MIKLSDLKNGTVTTYNWVDTLIEFVEAYLLKEQAFAAAVAASVLVEESNSTTPPSVERQLVADQEAKYCDLEAAEKRFDAAAKMVSL
jgi:hypothetical protein